MEQHNIEVASNFMKLNNLISLSIEALLISFYNCFIFSLRQWSCKIKNKCVNIMTLVLYWANDPLPQSYNYLTMCVSSPPWSSDPRFSHFDCSCSKGINKETNIVFSETYLRKTNSWCIRNKHHLFVHTLEQPCWDSNTTGPFFRLCYF